MSLNSLSRYDDAEDEIKDEDHGLQTKLPEQKAGSQDVREQNQSEKTTATKEENDVQLESLGEERSRPSSVLAPKPRGLVSYVGDDSDEGISTDEEENEETPQAKSAASNLVSAENSLSSTGSNSPNSVNESGEQSDATREITDTVRLPAEPEGRCSKSLQEKIARMIEKKKKGLNVNEYVQSKKEFRNPSIYEKLVNFIGINEHGTNFPKKLYDPTIWGPESHYDNLAKVQKEYHDRKEKEKLKRAHVDFVTGVKKTEGSGSGSEKKSKWDQKVALVPGK